MQPKLQPKKVRLNVQISSELKIKLTELSAFQGKRVSALVRESIEEKLEEIEKKIFEEKMKCAYQELAQENLKISDDFKYVDSENL
jgi:predicted DNA-binding protein